MKDIRERSEHMREREGAVHGDTAIVLLAGVLVVGGCSDHGPGTPDVATDTGNDLEPDTAPDPDMDPEPDTAPDTVVDTMEDPDADAPTTTPGFVTVTPGTFTMGSPTGEPGRGSDETEHTVTLTGSYEIMEKEVTQDQFYALMAYRPSSFSWCGGSCPVETVCWHEAAAYANALSVAGGYAECYACTGSGTGVSCTPSTSYSTPYDCPGYRLPTEAEWEYAARAGTTGGTYNGTSTLTDCTMPNTVVDPIAWFCGNSSSTTHEVGGKTANAWGLYDMLGNVWEWCHDWYGTYPGTVTDPWGPGTGSYRVPRGGSCYSLAGGARAAIRYTYDPGLRYGDLGFRLARSLP